MTKQTYKIDIDEFSEEVFYELERIADSSGNHEAEFYAESKNDAVEIVANRLKKFIEKQLSE